MNKYKKLLLSLAILVGLSTSVAMHASATTEKKFMDVTAKVDASKKNVHVTFQKNITEELKDAIADIEVINTENGQIAHFDDVKIGKDGKIIDDRINTFDGLLNKDFFLPSNQISGGGNGSDGSTGFPPSNW